MRGHVSALYVLGAVLGASLSLLVAPAFAVEPYEVDVGLWTCPRGYQIQTDGTCKSDAKLPHGPVVEISSLPSAGDGAPATCPSGACDALLAPLFYSIYSAPMQFAHGDWSWPYYDGWSSWPYYGGRTWPYDRTWSWPPFHGEPAFWNRASFGLARGGVPHAARRFHSVSARGSRPSFARGGAFGGTASGHRAATPGMWGR
jgi:hypothetical protein